MGNIVENPVWEETVFQVEVTTPLLGGSVEKSSFGTPTAGYLNVAQQQLANRTQYLKETLENTDVDVGGLSDRVDTVETSLTAHIGSRGAAHTNSTQTEAGFMSAADKTKLNGVETGAQVNVATNLEQGTRTATTVPVTSSTGTSATLGIATTSLAGVMSSADKVKLDGVATGAQVNQNTFGTVSVSGQSDVVADSVSDTLTLVAGTNVTITTNVATDAITINATATADTSKVAKAGDTMTGQLIGTQTRMGGYIDTVLINATTTGATGLACGTYSVFYLTLTGATTLSISNMPTFTAGSEALTIVVKIIQGATAQTLAWFSGITWLTAGGTAPTTPLANKTVEYIFTNTDGAGTAWVGRVGASN